MSSEVYSSDGALYLHIGTVGHLWWKRNILLRVGFEKSSLSMDKDGFYILGNDDVLNGDEFESCTSGELKSRFVHVGYAEGFTFDSVEQKMKMWYETISPGW